MKDLVLQLLKDLHSEELIKEEKFNELSASIDDKFKEYKTSVLAEAVDTLEEKKVQAIDEALTKMDEEHADKMTKVIETLKEEKEIALNSVDADHAEKLQTVIDKYNTELTEGIESKLSDYLDVYLEEVAPKDLIVAGDKLEKLEAFSESIKQLCNVNEISINEEVKEAFEDANEKLSAKDKEINALMIEKIEMSKKIEKIEATSLLETKCEDLSPKMAAYIKTRFADANAEKIEEEINEAIEAFTTEEAEEREKLREDAKSKVNPKAIITEDIEDETKPKSAMDKYVNRFGKSNTYTH